MTEQQNNQGNGLPSAGHIVDFLESSGSGANFRLNVRTGKIEYQCREIRFDCVVSWFYKTFGKRASKENLIDAIVFFGIQNEYDPFKEHLESIKRRIPTPPVNESLAFITRFCNEVLGVTNQLYIEYFKCFAIGVVARTFQPGCKHDDALILVGKQGIGKSTFFRELVGKDFFSDRLQGDLFKKDQVQLMMRYVVLEWAELDKHFGRDRIESIKAGLRTQSDDFRPPYGKDTIRIDRRFDTLPAEAGEILLSASQLTQAGFHQLR